ncbi:conserved exported hypothetical protein [Vibrio nigripulchritudo SOn1]|uniref:Lipoprotein n=1 Tax=Vibrio nigripulchritudo SOn1 TaxID=1238450 RepID=A0AAV2VSC7_9VIBR|nr:hypothetical protein [Vibrio nigripulchritudo]CCO47637.1 conserved exported hypothetical protein [Vibrio nigripulchritudo SOn1]
MKLRTLAMVSGIFLLAGCSVNNYEPAAPTASKSDIEMARQWLSEVENLEVKDDGYIHYTESLPGGSGYYWKTTTIRKISKEWSCGSMYPLLEKGFVVRMFFKGKGGKEEYFDKARCDAEETN